MKKAISIYEKLTIDWLTNLVEWNRIIQDKSKNLTEFERELDKNTEITLNIDSNGVVVIYNQDCYFGPLEIGTFDTKTSVIKLLDGLGIELKENT